MRLLEKLGSLVIGVMWQCRCSVLILVSGLLILCCLIILLSLWIMSAWFLKVHIWSVGRLTTEQWLKVLLFRIDLNRQARGLLVSPRHIDSGALRLDSILCISGTWPHLVVVRLLNLVPDSTVGSW